MHREDLGPVKLETFYVILNRQISLLSTAFARGAARVSAVCSLDLPSARGLVR